MTDDNRELGFVAEIEVNQPPLAFNTSMSDIITHEEDGPEVLDEEDVLPTISAPLEVETEVETEEEEEEEKKPDPVVEEEENLYEDYSEAALVGEALRKSRPDIFGNEIPKDLSWEDLIKNVDGYIDNTVQSTQSHLVNQTGDIAEYVDFLIGGGDPKTLEDALQNVKYSKLDLESATDDQKEELVAAMYKDMEVPPEEIKTLMENLKLGNKIDDKAVRAIARFDAKEKDIMKADIERKKADNQRDIEHRNQLTNSLNGIIDNGEVLGLALSEVDQNNLKEALFNPTEIREVSDGKGGTVLRKYTKYQILETEFKNSLEQQVAFAKLLIDGFKFDSIKEQGKRERDDDILNVLNNKGANASRSRKVSRNGYMTPVMEVDV